MGMRELDADIINFLHEDEESQVTKIKREAFELPKARKKVGPLDYLERGKTTKTTFSKLSDVLG